MHTIFRSNIFILTFLVHTRAELDFWQQRCMFAEDVCPNGQITFWLYKKNATRQGPLLINSQTLDRHVFEPHKPLKVLIHGFIGNRNLTPNLELRDLLLQTQNVHVLSVDYGNLVRFPCYYPWSVRNAPIVAKCVAQLLDALIDNNIYTAAQIHIIGFSLGAQIAGLTANYVRLPLQRITALDPAGPGFMLNDEQHRLDSSDANFIDVIHTDPFFFSLPTSMGHVDFYPNLQQRNQPGCSYFSKWRFYNCNHYRSAVYYAESITTELGFWALSCGSWLEFLAQRCNLYVHVPHTQMGYFVSSSASGAYFLSTNKAAPFAKGPVIDFEMNVIDMQ